MSTSLLYHGFGIRGYKHVRSEFAEGKVTFITELSKVRCPMCLGGEVVRHGERWRTLRTVPIGRKAVFIRVAVPRIFCRKCNKLQEIHPHFADPVRTYTHALEEMIVGLCRITTIKGAADFAGVSWDVAKDIERRRLERLYTKPSLKGLRYLAVDEIAVRRGHRYVSLVIDLETGRVLFVGDGKDAKALAPFLRRIRRSRTKVLAIAMDLSAAFARAVRDNLPGVPLVFDRFHVVKLMNERLDELRRAHVRDTERAQRASVKGVRYLVLMSPSTLDEREKSHPGSKQRLRAALAINEPLNKGYYLKEKLRLLWEEPDRASATRLLEEWCEEAEASGVRELTRMARTVASHREGILAYFDHGRITSGPLEGINNKIKTMKRMAYGYRDQEFFKLKILGLHESKYKLVG